MHSPSAALKKPLSIIRSVLIAASAPFLLGQPVCAQPNGSNLPDIGTAGLSALSLEKERAIGDVAMRQIRASYPMLHDPVLQEYLEGLGYKLVTSGSTPIHPFTFFWVNDDSINAFAFFGGHVGVHTGLLMAAENESELASVLAHEIAHVNQRHLARHIEQQMQMQPATLAATLGSILLTILAPQAGMAALQTSIAASQQMSINFTRKHEAEADRIGLQNLVAAGFDPYAMPSFFGKLAAEYRFVSKPPAFLMTHPLPESRVADAQLRAQQYQHQDYPANIDFQFAKARVLARNNDKKPEDLVQKLSYELSRPEYSAKDQIQYGLALAQFDSGNPKAALTTLMPLAEKYPRNLFLIDSMTDIDLALGNGSQAIERLSGFYQYMPDNQVIALNYANALLQQNSAPQAIDILKSFRLKSPDNLLALDLIADAYSKEGNLAQHYQARAEKLALMGQYEQAIAMLERALRATSNNQGIEIVKLEARLRQFRQELAQLKSL